MRMGVFFSAAAVCTLTVSGSAYAVTRYVATTGNNTNPGTQASPWATLKYATAHIGPGDDVIVRGGTYAEWWVIDVDGTALKPITFKVAAGETAIVQGNATTPPQEGQGLILINGQHVTVEGFEVKNSNGVGITAEADYSTVSKCKVHRSDRHGILIVNAKNVTVNQTTVFDNARVNLAHNQSVDVAGINVTDAIGVRLLNNTIYNNHNTGLAITLAYDTLVRGNTIYDNLHDNVYVNTSTGSVITRNFIYATTNSGFEDTEGRPNGIGVGDSGASNNNDVTNNIIVRCGTNLGWYKDGVNGGMKQNLWANNTLVQAQNEAIRLEGGSHVSSSFVNNLVVQSNGQILTLGTPSTNIAFNTNAWVGGTPPAGAKSNSDVNANCELTDVNAKGAQGYKISATSPCRDVGATQAQVDVDYFNTTRPVGAKYDIGAHEFVPPAPTPDGGVTPDSSIPIDGGAAPDSNVTADAAVTDASAPQGDTLINDGAAASGDGGSAAKDGATLSDTSVSPGDGSVAGDGTAKSGGCSCQTSTDKPASIAFGLGASAILLMTVLMTRSRFRRHTRQK